MDYYHVTNGKQCHYTYFKLASLLGDDIWLLTLDDDQMSTVDTKFKTEYLTPLKFDVM